MENAKQKIKWISNCSVAMENICIIKGKKGKQILKGAMESKKKMDHQLLKGQGKDMYF